MSTSTLAFEDAFKRHIGNNKDETAAAMAEEILLLTKSDADATAGGNNSFQLVAVGKKAMELWFMVPHLALLPITRDLLWSAAVTGWLNADSLPEEDAPFIDFISRGLFPTTGTNVILARIKENLDRPGKDFALGKVCRFMMLTDLADCSPEIVATVGRTLSRYATIQELLLCSHVLESVSGGANKKYHSGYTLKVAAPYIAAVAERAMKASWAVWAMCQRLEISTATVKMLEENSFQIVWESEYEHEMPGESKAHVRKNFVTLAGRIQDWRIDNPDVPRFDITLVHKVKSRAPDIGTFEISRYA